MGHVFAEIELSNPKEPDLVPIKAKALVDTRALMLCIPEHLGIWKLLKYVNCAGFLVVVFVVMQGA